MSEDKTMIKLAIWMFVILFAWLIFSVNCSSYHHIRFDMVGHNPRPMPGVEIISYSRNGDFLVNEKFIEVATEILGKSIHAEYIRKDVFLVDSKVVEKFYRKIEKEIR